MDSAELTGQVPATVLTDLAGIATALRHTLIQCREPDYSCGWMTVVSNHMLKIANAGNFLSAL
jgi:hypothetical protein